MKFGRSTSDGTKWTGIKITFNRYSDTTQFYLALAVHGHAFIVRLISWKGYWP